MSANGEVPLDDKTRAMAEGIYDGSLAYAIKNNTKYALTGIAIGAIGGFILASLLGKNKLVFGLAGAAIVGASGYLMAPRNKKDESFSIKGSGQPIYYVREEELTL